MGAQIDHLRVERRQLVPVFILLLLVAAFAALFAFTPLAAVGSVFVLITVHASAFVLSFIFGSVSHFLFFESIAIALFGRICLYCLSKNRLHLLIFFTT